MILSPNRREDVALKGLAAVMLAVSVMACMFSCEAMANRLARPGRIVLGTYVMERIESLRLDTGISR